MPHSIGFQIQDIKCEHLPESPWPTRWVKKKFSVKLILDGEEYDTGPMKGSTTISWSSKFSLRALGLTSPLEIEVRNHHRVSNRIELIGHAKDTVHDLLEESSSVVQILRIMNQRSGAKLKFSIALQDSNLCPPISSFEPSETPCTTAIIASANAITDADKHSNSVLFDQQILVQDDSICRRQREEEIGLAEKSIDRLQLAPPITDKIDGAVDGSAKFADIQTPFWVSLSGMVDKIRPFVDTADKLAEIHPYAKIAWSILSLIPKSIIAQRERDESLCNLMETIKDVHIFLAEVEPLEIIDSQRKMAEDMGRLTVESAHLIRHYTVNENFWKRVATLAHSTASAKIQKIQDQLQELKAAFQLRAVAHIEIKVFQIEITTLQILERTKGIDIDNTLRGMPYGKGGRYNSDKACPPGTRTAVLDELHRLINLPDDDSTPRLLVLTGDAGCGKSAIAHAIAKHYDGMKRLGSSVFFDQADQQPKCHSSNLLSTVAHDIADLDTRWKTALYEIVKGSHSLRSTNVIPDQMESFIIGPAKALNIIGPIVIVIDALDKSGNSKGDLTRSFMKRASDLPNNFRILITATSESGFSNNQHVKIMPIEPLSDVNIESPSEDDPRDSEAAPEPVDGGGVSVATGLADKNQPTQPTRDSSLNPDSHLRIQASGKVSLEQMARLDITKQVQFQKHPSNLIGEGSLSQVYKARYTKSRSEQISVVVKIVHCSSKGKELFMREIIRWKRVSQQEDIVDYMGIYHTPPRSPFPYLVMPYYRNNKLLEYMTTRHLDERLARAKEIARGLDTLHGNNIIHGDLKPENIFVSDDGHARIADFGLFMTVHDHGFENPIHRTVRMRHSPPELLPLTGFLPVIPTRQSDIFSLGILFLKLFDGRVGCLPYAHVPPSPRDPEETNLLKRIHGGDRPKRANHPNISDNMWNIIAACWAADPSARPNIRQVRSWLGQV